MSLQPSIQLGSNGKVGFANLWRKWLISSFMLTPCTQVIHVKREPSILKWRSDFMNDSVNQ